MNGHEPKRLGDLNGRWTLFFKAAALFVTISCPFLLTGAVAAISTAVDHGERLRSLESWKETIVPERTRALEDNISNIREIRSAVERLSDKMEVKVAALDAKIDVKSAANQAKMDRIMEMVSERKQQP